MAIEHGQWILNHLREFDSFLDTLTTIADMGCGEGKHISWWSTLETRDDDPVPYNYKCYAVDKDAKLLDQVPETPNLIKINADFTKKCIPTSVDLMWAHDSLQYSTNPLETLKLWNEQMSPNGMLVLAMHQHTGVEHNQFVSRSHSGAYFHYTPVNLIYMLAVNGFDCRDAYLLKQFNDPWLNMAVYKSADVEPMDPATTTWYDLVGKELLHPTAENSINQYGYLRQEDILYPWLDKNLYYVDYIQQRTEIPEEAGPTIQYGEPNEVRTPAEIQINRQPNPATVSTRLREQIKPKQPEKKRYAKV